MAHILLSCILAIKEHMLGLLQGGTRDFSGSFGIATAPKKIPDVPVSEHGKTGTFYIALTDSSLINDTVGIFDFGKTSDEFKLYLKEAGDVIDETLILNDWKTIGNDMRHVMLHWNYGEHGQEQ